MDENVELKALAAEVKAVETENPNGEFEAIISTASVDRDGESISPGAFNPLPASLPIYHSHDWMDKALPVARAVPFYDGDVLKAKGTFASTPRAQELRSLVNEGIVTHMSVGFIRATKSRKDKTTTKGELIEASFTAIPVNTTAAVLASKALAELKAGARNSTSDSGRLQQIHDLSVENGATCGATKAIAAEEEPTEEASSESKAVDAPAEEAGALTAEQEERERLTQRARVLQFPAV